MAMADYRTCDVCGGKAFYDANLNYSDGTDERRSISPPFRIAGAEQYDEPRLLEKYGTRLDYVGDWAVICTDCAKTHKVVVQAIASTGDK